jgi:ribosomal protein S18 acetylase RimI-like enzyme
MKAKELKILRKRLTKSNRTDCDILQCSVAQERLIIQVVPDGNTDSPSPAPSLSLSLKYFPSSELSDGLFNECLDLFQTNMANLYEASSWGLDLKEKELELRHVKARFLFLLNDNQSNNKLAAFVHFRFEYDDEESPSRAVLYVYEIQIESNYRRYGIGRKLMGVVEAIAAKEEMSKVVLTVFKANQDAMKFYETLGYAIDETSPPDEDYTILSRAMRSNVT